MTQFGFVLPALIDADGTIIAGEARVEAARRLGMAAVPVIVNDQLSKAQVKAYCIADNRLAELAEWDEARLKIEFEEILAIGEVSIEVLGWETSHIDIILDGSADSVGDADPADEQIEPPVSPVSHSGDLWRLGKHRLICGSSLDKAVWDRLLDGGVAAMSFTDPGVADGEFYLLHVERDRFETPELRHRIEALHLQYAADQTLIEEDGVGRALVQDLRRTSPHCRPLLVKPKYEKLARMEARAVMFEQGRILVPESADWRGCYLEELLSFPQSTKDDQVDSTSQALDYLQNHFSAKLRERPQGRKRPTGGRRPAAAAQRR